MTKTVQLFRIINANASTLHYPLSVWNVWCVTVMVTVAGSLSISVSVPECARCNVRGELIRCHSAMITFIYEIKIAKNRVIHAHIDYKGAQLQPEQQIQIQTQIQLQIQAQIPIYQESE